MFHALLVFCTAIVFSLLVLIGRPDLYLGPSKDFFKANPFLTIKK